MSSALLQHLSNERLAAELIRRVEEQGYRNDKALIAGMLLVMINDGKQKLAHMEFITAALSALKKSNPELLNKGENNGDQGHQHP